ncbi:3'-5' exonuclease [Vibrio sp. Isolate24]|uniref:3'-5' exonuclease n=1 Tax=Vibrio sp. Isolate24 TaxID=2908534 RepID=UPI001EFC7522|nr:3'-5' exonuclease [Vibrio sp. Isolate24]MCG9678716.1 3'-5' exoribonuclease [Vibrio sp. Isolate24]
MKIKELPVERDEMGFWTHPELPDFGEIVSKDELRAFEIENHITMKVISMESDAEQQMIDEWFEDGETCIKWEPTPPSRSSFLLSIHDTEDGPFAWWAVPKPIEIMIDVECMGKGSKAPLTSIGAVVFNPRTGELGADFEEIINLNSSVYYGGEIDSSTVVWWLQQSEEARAIYAKDTPKSSLKDALLEFNQWLADLGHSNDLYLWGNGKEFDNVIVKNAFESTRIKPNFSHWNDMDVRTIVKLGRDILGIDPKSTLEREGVHHSALADAKFQARYVSEIWQALYR